VPDAREHRQKYTLQPSSGCFFIAQIILIPKMRKAGEIVPPRLRNLPRVATQRSAAIWQSTVYFGF
jgi:hypothetical protein